MHESSHPANRKVVTGAQAKPVLIYDDKSRMPKIAEEFTVYKCSDTREFFVFRKGQWHKKNIKA